MRRVLASAFVVLLLLLAADTVESARPRSLDPNFEGALDRLAALDGLDKMVRVAGGTRTVREHLAAVEQQSSIWIQVEGPERECDGGTLDGRTVGEVLDDLGRRCGLFYDIQSPHQLFVLSPFRGGAGDVSNPRVLRESSAARLYPARARELDVEGNAILQVSVLSNGTVGATSVLREKPVGYDFGTAAAELVRKYAYLPGELDGEPVEASLIIFVEFSLDAMSGAER